MEAHGCENSTRRSALGTALLAFIVLGSPPIAWAASFGGTATSSASTPCDPMSPVGPIPEVLGEATAASSSGPCSVPRLGTYSSSAYAHVDQLGISYDISGSATASGAAISGASPAGASAEATYFDTVTLISPLIDYTGGVPVTASDNYTINVSGVASAQILCSITSINGAPVPSPPHISSSFPRAAQGRFPAS